MRTQRDRDATAPGPLLDDIAAGRCLPFIGAGFSLNANCGSGTRMPTWADLTRKLADVLGIDPKLDGPDVAAAYERNFGRVSLVDAIRDAVLPEEAHPGAAHRAFVELPFDTIYTTNFDLLIEAAFQETRRPYRALVGELQMPFHGGFLSVNIVKMHGDIRHEEHVVATRQDYDSYLERYPVVATHLSAMLITRTALFIGYSRTDPDFQHIEKVVKSRLGKFQRMPYLVEFGLQDAEVQRALDAGLHVINIPDHPGISRGTALAELFSAMQNELDLRVARKLRKNDPTVFEEVSDSALERTYQESDSADLFASSSNLCFVMMPFAPQFDRIYTELIIHAAEFYDLSVRRADSMFVPGSVVEYIRVAIQQSRICIADITNSNANVLFEVGLAQAMGKPVLLIAEEGTAPPFNIADIRIVFYRPDDVELSIASMRSALDHLLQQGKLEEAERLISNGMHRAGVAELGVLIEHTLRRAIETRGERITSSRPGAMSLGNMISSLAAMNVIDDDMVGSLRQFASIRNRSVHQLEDPSRDEAELALSLARQFMKNPS